MIGGYALLPVNWLLLSEIIYVIILIMVCLRIIYNTQVVFIVEVNIRRPAKSTMMLDIFIPLRRDSHLQ